MFQHPKMRYVYCGIDSHKDTHTAVILNCFFEKLAEFTFKNLSSDFEDFLIRANRHKSKDISIVFGLEDVSAYGRNLAVYLHSKGYSVKHVNSSLVAHERSSLNTLHKSDSFDAECAARVLINRLDLLPQFNPYDKFWTLSKLVKRRNSLIKTGMALKNQLHDYVMHHYPSYKKWFPNIDAKSSLAFFEKYPSPAKLEGVTQVDIVELFQRESKHLFYKDKKAKLILDCVSKDSYSKIPHQAFIDEMIISTVKELKTVIAETKEVEKLIREFLPQFGYKLQSMRGIDDITAANLINEIGDINRFPNASKLSRYAGISPVSYSSGKTDLQFANERGNRKLNGILFKIAVTLCNTGGRHKRITNPIFYDYYKKKISEGKTSKQAFKCVQRRLVNIIWSMMKNKTEYQNPPTRKLEE
ncbi:IS110 family transposase [Herbivorax sp. ANBcel31]|uniref:IS110 family transposase n=1 Tax=Herbivorax sp. ANBcel31 TaxID=3069754 RepID=UPI0027B36C5B|nr:IS110 family transposase [Herbivorax sp. ANBcel31]MDQ2088215.1 IS110 family transposase [Herbivorax sp. ANBcel31]